MNVDTPNEFWHVSASLVTLCASSVGFVVSLVIKRAVSRYEALQAEVKRNSDDISWIRGVLEASGIIVRPVGPGIGGRA